MDLLSSKIFHSPSTFENMEPPLCDLNLEQTSAFAKPFPTGSNGYDGRNFQASLQRSREGVKSVTQRKALEAPPTPGRPVFNFSIRNPYRKTIPSKWDDAEKWLMNSSCTYSSGHGLNPVECRKFVKDCDNICQQTEIVVEKSNQYSFDWRNDDILTPVRDQMECNCCWAITAAGAIESLANITHGRKGTNKIQLSVQQLVDCVNENPSPDITDAQGCYLSHYRKAFEWIIIHGLAEERYYPYEAKRGPCRRDVKVLLKIRDYKRINIRDLDYYLRSQPVAVAVRITRELRNLKTSDIYKGPTYTKNLQDNSRHAVLAVGFGIDEEGEKFWIVKNSWGTIWGDQGYGKISQRIVTVLTIQGEKEMNLLESPMIPLDIEFIP